MSKELWEQNLDLWKSQDKMNDLHSKRIDQLTQLVGQLAEVVEALGNDAIAKQPACTGKQCRCGKVAH